MTKRTPEQYYERETDSPMGAPRRGREVRERYSVRLEPSVFAAAKKKFGTFTAAVEAGLQAVGIRSRS
jgi:hypothetical protein